ncbi:MAG: carboxylating nicotinate-nucleotide diphosphorylase [Promethearchaeota archaeon]
MSYNRFLIEKKIKEFLEEDCSYFDVSSLVIPDDSNCSAKIIAKNQGFISGIEELEIIFNFFNLSSKLYKKDGDKVGKQEIIVAINGKCRDILFVERTALNLITHMSAITSTTRYYVDLIEKSGKNVKIACTRKTLPGLRIFEKKAVMIGGGEPHRFSLDDLILLKDTHLKFFEGNIKKILQKAKEKASFTKKIEIEVEKVEDVIIAAEVGADIIMLDNMTPEEVKTSIDLLKQKKLRNKVIIEVSGGITRDNILEYILTEPDVISTSELTQFPFKKVDFSLEFD